MSTATDNMIENPLNRLTAEQIEELGREFDELHEQVKSDLGERDSSGSRRVAASSWARPASPWTTSSAR